MAGMFDGASGLSSGAGLGVDLTMPGAVQASFATPSALGVNNALLDGGGNALSGSGAGNIMDYLSTAGDLAGGAAKLAHGQQHQVVQNSGGNVSSGSPASPRAPMQQLSIPSSAYPTQPNSLQTTLPAVNPQSQQTLAAILNSIANIK